MYLFSHPRGTWALSKLQGLQYYFSEKFGGNLRYYESRNFSDSSPHYVFESENFRFPFLYKKWPKMGSEMWKIKIQKVKGNLLDKLRKLYVHKRNGHLEIFSRPQVIENSRQYFLLRRDIHRKKYLGAPGTIWVVKSKRRHHIITIRAGCSSSRN